MAVPALLVASMSFALVLADDPPVPAPGVCGLGEDHHDGAAWGSISLTCSVPGELIGEVLFASYGTFTVSCDGWKCPVQPRGSATPCAEFAAKGTSTCGSCDWSAGDCSDQHTLQPFVEKLCLGKASCGPIPVGHGKGYGPDPCSGVAKRLGVAVRCCPAGKCPISGGASLSLVLVALALAYLVGGVALGSRVNGAGVSLHAHPHYPNWLHVVGLVQDGVSFVRGGRAGGYARVGRDGAAPEGTPKGEAARSDGQRGGPSSRRPEKEPRQASGRGESRKKKAKRRHENSEATGTAAERPAPVAEPASAPAAGTPSAGGGRWVHVPN
eukprot:COSAG04_NODE_946_length_9227_cov_9.312555_3_plen_326_part_00